MQQGFFMEFLAVKKLLAGFDKRIAADISGIGNVFLMAQGAFTSLKNAFIPSFEFLIDSARLFDRCLFLDLLFVFLLAFAAKDFIQ